jgi:hypothetical protein
MAHGNSSFETRRKAVCVLFDGPEPDVNRDGDEVPVWTVCAADEDGDPIGTVYSIYSFSRAEALAQKMADDRRLEYVCDASRA